MSAIAASAALAWVARAAWAVVLVAGWTALDAAADEHKAVFAIVQVVAGLVWLLGVAALAFPSVATLTMARVTVPCSVIAGAALWVSGAPATASGITVVAAIIATVVVGSGEFGRAWVQSSAYGEEDRYPLRAPIGYLVGAVIAWTLAAGAATTAALLVAADRPWWALPGVAVAAAVSAWSWPRWQQLSRRWLVIVPIGLVIHDPVVLAETVMLPRNQVGRVALAPADTRALDLTGPAPGHAIEVSTTETVTAILAATPSKPTGNSIHLDALLVAPSRPGAALAAVADRRLGVKA